MTSLLTTRSSRPGSLRLPCDAVPGGVSHTVAPRRHRSLSALYISVLVTDVGRRANIRQHMPSGDHISVGILDARPRSFAQTCGRNARSTEWRQVEAGLCGRVMLGASRGGWSGLRRARSQVIVREFAFSLLTGLLPLPCGSSLDSFGGLEHAADSRMFSTAVFIERGLREHQSSPPSSHTAVRRCRLEVPSDPSSALWLSGWSDTRIRRRVQTLRRVQSVGSSDRKVVGEERSVAGCLRPTFSPLCSSACSSSVHTPTPLHVPVKLTTFPHIHTLFVCHGTRAWACVCGPSMTCRKRPRRCGE